jgi:hypothetical protein
MQPTEKLLIDIIDVQCLFEIIEEEYQYFYESEIDVDINRLKKRISDAKKLKLNYLTILN